MALTNFDFQQASNKLRCEIAVIKAVDYVESRGAGFNRNGSMKILFEGHIFWRELKKKNIDPRKYVSGNENVLYNSWTKSHYSRGANSTERQKGEWYRLTKAIAIGNNEPKQIKDTIKECALMSCSWGRYQIMGFNHNLCGFEDVFDMYFVLNMGENKHLDAFVNFVINTNLSRHLRTKNWAGFARGYNGKGYKRNKYDTKLANAYLRFK